MLAKNFLVFVTGLAVVSSTPDFFDGGNIFSDGIKGGMKAAEDTFQQGQKVVDKFMKGGTEQEQKIVGQANKTEENTLQQEQKSVDNGEKPAGDAKKNLVKQGKRAFEDASKGLKKFAKGDHKPAQQKGNS